MGIAAVQHTYNSKTGLPADGVVNTWYFESADVGPAVTEANGEILANIVLDFYDQTVPSFGQVRTHIAESAMAELRHTIKVYDLEEAKPRAPKYSVTTANGVANNSQAALPAEVAICLSYRASLTSGLNAARRRGRIYLGPLSQNVIDVDANGFARPDETVRIQLVQAANVLSDATDTEGWAWAVYSRANELANNLAMGMQRITDVWVDDAFDTQRRRGVSASTRTMLEL